MNKNSLNTSLKWLGTIFAVLALIYLSYILFNKSKSNPEGVACTMEAKLCPDGTYVGRSGPKCEFAACPEVTAISQNYFNDQYGFSIALTENWKGYTVIGSQWEGFSLEITSPQGQVITEHGPLISIRHPLWSTANPRQDIPVMVFSLKQWNDLTAEKYHIGAAPIGPSELGRNSRYVLGLPARYNFAFPAGFEEVEQLVHTLKTYEPK